MAPWRCTWDASVGPSAYSYRRQGGLASNSGSRRRWKAGWESDDARPASSARRRALSGSSARSGRATLAATGHQSRVDHASQVSHLGPPPSLAQAWTQGTISWPGRKPQPGRSAAEHGTIGTANVPPSRSLPARSVLGFTSLRLGRLFLVGGEDPRRALHAALLTLFMPVLNSLTLFPPAVRF